MRRLEAPVSRADLFAGNHREFPRVKETLCSTGDGALVCLKPAACRGGASKKSTGRVSGRRPG